METLFHDAAVEKNRRHTAAAVALGHVQVEMTELQALWDELRERGECWNGMTHHYLTERYGSGRLYHMIGVGWFVRPYDVPDFATPVDPERAWMLRWGPSCIPVRDLFGGYSHPGGHPDYGRYIPIDLDENNRHQLDAYCERNPDRPRPALGWGVCRQGFGLQHHDGVLSEAEAESWAIGLNRAINIGEN